MNREDKPASETRVVEASSLRVYFAMDEDGHITYYVAPDERLRKVDGVSALAHADRGAPFTLVANALLAQELHDHILVSVLERTEMRFRRAGRWDDTVRPGRNRPALAETVAGEDDCVH